MIRRTVGFLANRRGKKVIRETIWIFEEHVAAG